MIALKAGDYTLQVAPEVGACICRFDFDGKPVLRRCAPSAAVTDSSCYPLVPFANRIENGILHHAGKHIRLSPNMGDHPHPLHGHGWRSGWRTVACDAAKLVLAFDYEADEWPWSYTSEQCFALSDGGLHLRLSVRNRAHEAMPVSLGLHPFFPRLPGSVLHAKVGGVWLADATCIPTDHVEASRLFDPSGGAALCNAPFVDHCFTGWDGHARIAQPDLGLALTMAASDCRFFHIFIPEGADFFAAEPVSAMPNAFNRSEDASVTGARLLPPGERFAVEMRIAAERL